MRLVMCVVAAAIFGLAGALPASAQIKWTGLYVGADLGVGFKTLDFSVADSSQVGISIIANGHSSEGLNVGGHVGMNGKFGKVVVGGEFGFGKLFYHGEVLYSLGKDTLGETDGGIDWTATARAGYVIDHVMPYYAVGVLTSKNTGHVIDACNTPPCGSSLGEGSHTVSATRWIYALGAEFAMGPKIAGRSWTLRLEWMQLENGPVLNTVTRTLTGVGVPAGQTAPVDFTTNLPHGMLRVLVDVRLRK